MAENYPKIANESHREGCRKFLSGLPYMLPCGECGYHFRNFEATAENDHYHGVCKGRDSLRQHLVTAHNQVNSKQRHPKQEWTTERAQRHYAKIPAIINNPDKWRSESIL